MLPEQEVKDNNNNNLPSRKRAEMITSRLWYRAGNGISIINKASKRSCECRREALWTWRCYSVTGHPGADRALQVVTGGRIETWLQKYESLVGLTEVRSAQNKVIEAENTFQKVQVERRQSQQQMTDIQNKLKDIHVRLDKLQRGDERYLTLLTEEYEILKEEKKLVTDLSRYEQLEREHFAALSSAVRESHEKERARAERTKYWSIMGSIIGAAIGIVGTSINKYLRMRELKGLVREGTASGVELKGIVGHLSQAVQTQFAQIHTFLYDLKVSIGSSDNLQSKVTTAAGTDMVFNELLETRTREILESVKHQEINLRKDMELIKKLLVTSSVGEAGNVVYVGPEVETLLEKTEKGLEWKIKSNALMTTGFIYGAGLLTFTVMYYLFRGASGS